MKTLTTALISLLMFAGPLATGAAAQNDKKTLKQMEQAAGTDLDQLFQAAVWAKEHGLLNDRRRILQSIIKKDPDHKLAREALGFVEYDGEWMTASKAKVLREREKRKEMEAKGLVSVDGVWVEKDEVKDARKGIFYHDDQRVSRGEKIALSAGMVRHPKTGAFIAEADMAKAEEGMFPLGDDEWGTQEEADRYHAAEQQPWVYRSTYCTVVSNTPLAQILELAQTIDSGIETAQPLFGGIEPSPLNRPVIVIARDSDQYRKFGENFGDEGSAYAVFRAINPFEVPGVGNVRPVVTNDAEGWGPYWMRHAAGLAFADAIAADLEAELPEWFVRGVAGLCERHYVDGVASFFGKQHLEKGGVKDLDEWFDRFEISGNLENRMLDFNVYQAGLVLAFAMYGGDEDALEAIRAVTDAATKDGKALTKAVTALQKVLIKREDEIREYLRGLTAGK
jgi:hypothetical protein